MRCRLSISTLLPAALLLLTPVCAAAQQGQVGTLIDEQHYLRARSLTQAILAKAPDNVQALVHQSVIDWAFSRLNASLATAEKAVTLAENSAQAQTALTNAIGAKLLDPAIGTFEKMSLARRFRKVAERALQLDPTSLDALDDSAQFYWSAPGIVGGDKAKAMQYAERLSQADPVRGAKLKATFAADERNPAKRSAAVEAIWKSAVAARPRSYDAHVGLSGACLRAGDLRCAETEARHALTLQTGRAAAYRQLATVYATEGHWTELERTLHEAHAAVPDDLSPAYEAAHIILARDANTQLARAEQYLRTYLSQPAEGEAPTHAEAHWRLGLVLAREGRKSDAVQELQTAVRMDSSLEGAKQDLKKIS